MRLWSALAWGVLLALASTPAAAQTEQRVGLVIGNGTYVNAPTLKNPPNDAKAMAAALRRAGFDVIERENATRRGMIEALRTFAEKLSPGGIGLFFYAGHGVQARGANYLIPIDAALAAEDDLRYETTDVQDVLNRLDDAKVRLSLVILDACRDNPFSRSFRSTARGLAQIDAPRGTLIAYATAPGKEAADGDGDNGVYTAELLKAMSLPGLKLQEVFEHVIDAVERKTANEQTPWISSSFRGDFYFIGPTTVTISPPAPAPAIGVPAAIDDRETVFWTTIKDSTMPADFEDYLKRFPSGTFASLAQRRLDALKKAAPQQAMAVPPLAPPGPAVQDLDASFIALRTAKVRAEPSATSKEVGSLSPETVVQATGRVGKDWLRVAWKGGQAYVSAPLLQDVDPAEVAGWGKVKGAKKPDEVEAFLRSYPKGFYAERATILLASLRAPPSPTPAPSSSPPQVAVATPPAPPQPARPAAFGQTFRDCADCPEMMVIPPGEFMMGTSNEEAAREDLSSNWAAQERPRHKVTVGSAFALGKYPVTRGEYARFAQATGHNGAGCNGWTGSTFELDGGKSWRNPGFAQSEQDPVVCVNWDDAKAYLAWLSQTTGKAYRLPSEAEWEYAARAGTATAYWWGDEIGRNRADCNGCGSQWDGKRTAPVGSFQANPFGLHDILGNAWQWVEDCWVGNYAGAPSDAGIIPASGDCGRHVQRGGSWTIDPRNVRAGNRLWNLAGFRSNLNGFRAARNE
jgi:formylglycine-generating enzyme required for sulfatase activity